MRSLQNFDISGERQPREIIRALVQIKRSSAVVNHLLAHAEGRRIAAGIPGARFVALEGQNHLVLEGDPGWSRLLDEIKTFLKS